jgi:hypothetical protein
MPTELTPDEVLQAVASLAGEHFVQQAIDRAARMKLENALAERDSSNGKRNSPISMVPTESEIG